MQVSEQKSTTLSFEEIAKRLELALKCLDDDNVPLATSVVAGLLAELKQK